MRITLKVMPGAKRDQWKAEGQEIKVYLNAPAVDGKANAALVRFLAGHFGVKISQVEIIKGLKSRHKVINIEGI
jgi:uncharacterized protein (TIGR00251 family)